MELVLLLPVWLLFSCLSNLTEANLKHSPRMIFSDTAKILSLPEHQAPVQILLDNQKDTAIAVGQAHVIFPNFQDCTNKEEKVLWQECKDCNYNITVVQWREKANHLFVCGTNGRLSQCCDLNVTQPLSTCFLPDELRFISDNIEESVIKEGEQAALVESGQKADLYITQSGSQEHAGLYKFGEKTVRPVKCNKDEHYVGLVVSKGREDRLQDKVYAFYKQKNTDTSTYSDMWLPFVTRVCMSDRGGPKNRLQYKWTSQLNAKLFCGNNDTKQHFSELVDTATVHADHWQDTKIYALFRNEWGMSAVCVYTIRDIDKVFAKSTFKNFRTEGDTSMRRECVADSTSQISSEILTMIERTTEMDDWVLPVKNSGPILFSHHNYTHIYADKWNNDFTVLFLSLSNGAIHKVTHNESDTFITAEYKPFKEKTHIVGMLLHPQSGKLYVSTRRELAQLDVANCDQYGNTTMDCSLSRDPYCHWNGKHCTKATGIQQAETSRNTGVHPAHRGKEFRNANEESQDDEIVIKLRNQSKFFLKCPVSSRHAQYTWVHTGGNTSCSSKNEQCLLLIDSMDRNLEGTHKCISEEMGDTKILATYRLQLENRAVGQQASLMLWVCLVFVLINSWFHL
ncbi:semaphorin-7A [Mugil cephalus]|uniref:semaphorin-7A n=1 Tax=Mugil cephalus TaxID=48193 RepID=UPI001FB74FB8|nr:semaphorin-7A [Mugil cephalus]